MKKRLDVLLFEKGMVPSRERAKAIIMSGIVYVNNQKADKAGMSIPEDAEIEIRGKTNSFVSRGGLKIEKALNYFQIDPKDLCVMDIGASTGGFTDCLLTRGARKVYSIDVGYGQLAWKLRQDPRVVCMERTNIRYVTPEQLEDVPDFAVIDVSFISLKLVLPVVANLLQEHGRIACLIKPQFEAGKGKVGKKGVVRDPEIHLEVLQSFIENAHEAGFHVYSLTFSPIKGPEGNIEFLGYLGKDGEDAELDPAALVAEAHGALAKHEEE
ncbi:MAG: TlyA family RNA methyltransferase [Butyricicoccus sp.]|nr:TlyA family RNA methyltransferase [Butyricicoccus sp.]